MTFVVRTLSRTELILNECVTIHDNEVYSLLN